MKIALVHDWLTGMRGGEAVLEALCELYPEADLFTLVHEKGSVSPTIEKHTIKTSPLQKFPGGVSHYKFYLPLLPVFPELIDLSGYDLVISSSHAVAKNVRSDAAAIHISYVHSPMRYIWEMFDEYFDRYFGGLSSPWYQILNQSIKLGVEPWRLWDAYTAKRVDKFVVNSSFVGQRVRNYYQRNATVIHPPVDVEDFISKDVAEKQDYYIIVSALVPYKRVDLAVEAFNKSGRKLVVVGKGSELEKLQKIARANIEFTGFLEREEMIQKLQKARGFIYPQIEDFGITAVEAQAAGTPVIAYGVGGATETVIDKETGIFFNQQTPESLNLALDRFERLSLSRETLIQNARRFRKENFKQKFAKLVESYDKSYT